MTVGFSYGAGAEIMTLVTSALGGKLVSKQKNPKQLKPRKPQKNRALGIHFRDLNRSSGYQKCGLGVSTAVKIVL